MKFEMQTIEHTMLHKNARFGYYLLPFICVQYQRWKHVIDQGGTHCAITNCKKSSLKRTMFLRPQRRSFQFERVICCETFVGRTIIPYGL